MAKNLIGIILLVLGILFLVGAIGIPFLPTVLAAGAIAAGILVLMNKVDGPNWLGVTLLFVGVAMIATDWLAFIQETLASVINLVVGIVLVVLGVLRLK